MYCCNTKIKKSVSLILAVAGIGKRMGLKYPKQFLKINDKPLFIFPLEIAEKNGIIDEIIIVTNKQNIELVENYCKQFKIKKIKAIVAGGKERQHSVQNALQLVNDENIVLIQDGVRPFLKDKYIDECCKSVALDGVSSVVGVCVKDTIKVINPDYSVISTPKRENLIAVQTPQAFLAKTLKKAFKIAEKENFIGTDDASLVEKIGEKVKIILGDYDNIKITTQEDLTFLEKIKLD